MLLASGVAVAGAGETNLRSLEHETMGMKQLVLPVKECTKKNPCGKCRGDCDSDKDCKGNLVCYHKEKRATNDEEATVPGK